MNKEQFEVVASAIFDNEDDEAGRVPAKFRQCFYGEPFVTTFNGSCYLVIEDGSGCPSPREISQTFYDAWVAEFGAAAP